MNSLQIELWAISIIEQVLNGKPNEDSRVELKSEFPASDFRKTARQIAAHSNTARGEPILWIIGVDQKKQVINEVIHQEVSTWYEKVKAEFDERIAPTLKDVNISYNGKPIVALFFDTERFPFVVKYSNEILEVPWREGTATRSANRFDLLKLLTPLQMLPRLEVLAAVVDIVQHASTRPEWQFHLQLYIEPTGNSPLIIPFHRCEASIELPDIDYIFPISDIRLVPPYSMRGVVGSWQSYNTSLTIESTPDEILIGGPGKIIFRREISVEDLPAQLDNSQKILFKFSMFPVNAQAPIRLEIVLKRVANIDPKEQPNITHKWLSES